MCGRFTLFDPIQDLAKEFGVPVAFELPPRYNIAPRQEVAVVRTRPDAPPKREFALLRWGLVPSWAKDPSVASRLINARAETVSAKPAFRTAFRRRRCLVPASGFYEWQNRETRKQPYLIRLRSRRAFAFAGLWERWEDAGGSALETCAILTTDANDVVKPIHVRMPVIVAPRDYAAWLDPAKGNPEELASLLAPYDAREMESFPVRTLVNDPSREGPECIREAS